MAEFERAGGILAKISEKAGAKASWYPPAENMWMSEADYALVNSLQGPFAWRHMAFVLQSLVFEMMCEGSFKDATALMEWQIRKNIDMFRSDQLFIDRNSPNKMFYDSVRITGLKISTAINTGLIKLSQAEAAEGAAADIEALKIELVRNLICICANSMLLKQNDIKHLSANRHHVQYSNQAFSDVIAKYGLADDFAYTISYMEGLTQ